MTITVYLCFFVLKNNSTIKIIKKGKKKEGSECLIKFENLIYLKLSAHTLESY